MIKCVKFVSVYVTDQDRALEFYTEKLGMEDRVGSFMNLSFLCDDVERTYDVLAGRGVEFSQLPGRRWVVPISPSW